MKLLSVDPGVSWAGAAVFDIPTKTLLAARRFRGTGFNNEPWVVLDVAKDIAKWAAKFGTFDALAMEWPQVYGIRQRGRKDPNDLLPLAGLDLAILALLDPHMQVGATCELYQPHQWKGSKHANPTARLIVERLRPEERTRVEDFAAFMTALSEAERKDEDVGHPAHNTLDGVGVGLKYLRRFERERVIHR